MPAKRRILVSMGLSVTPRNVELALANLWTRESVEIAGVFIEDLELLNLGRLPVSREIRYDDANPRVPDAGELERQMQAHGRRIRAVFEGLARRMNVVSSFRVARGPEVQSLVDACAGFDVVVLASARDWLGQRLAVRAQIPALLERGPPTVVIVREPRARGGCVAVVYQDSASANAALERAADIARAETLPLAVLLPAAEPQDLARLRRQAEAVVGAYPRATYHGLAQYAAGEIALAAARLAARVLILPRSGAATDRQLAVDIVERSDCSVILTS